MSLPLSLPLPLSLSLLISRLLSLPDWLLHEAIYCDGPSYGASAWAAERVQASLGETWDYTTRLEAGSAPIQLTGEMVYSWMADDFAWLKPLKPCAEILAQKADWARLYDEATLGREDAPPVAALVSYEDIYVERDFSEATARLIGPAGHAKLWITNEFQHCACGRAHRA